ncbi:MAG: cation diffusion facilitator family transporter [Gammaproteobacteria bacterium]
MNRSHEHHHPVHHTLEKGLNRLLWAFLVNLILTVVQVAGGMISGSLALIADALHNLSDAASLAIAIIARRWAGKPADSDRTFGYKRAELIGAMINLTSLLIIGGFLIVEAIARSFHPQPVVGWMVVIIAAIALIIDSVTVLLTHALSGESLNMRAAYLHNLADALGSIAVIVAGSLIILYEWYLADILCTLLIAAYIIYHGITEICVVIRILMQSTPTHIKLRDVVREMEKVPYVQQVYHVHIWELDENECALEAHVKIDYRDIEHTETTKHRLKTLLKNKFDIGHSTLEFEFDGIPVEYSCNDKEVISGH